MSSPTLSQKLTAEALGTAILVFIGAGSVPLTVFLTGKNPFGSAELSTISFAFAFAIFAAVYGRAPAGFAGIVIGFIVYGIIILVGPITGAALNPARQVGPEVLEAIIGKAQDWGAIWVYIAGPIVGGLVGGFLYEYVGHH